MAKKVTKKPTPKATIKPKKQEPKAGPKGTGKPTTVKQTFPDTPAPRNAEMPDGDRPVTDLASLLSDDTHQKQPPHLIIQARAGTGKTTTLIEGLKRIKGLTSNLIPSPQQKAVWDAMELSRGKAETICFVAFNKSIADELKKRIPAGCNASTMHGMGLSVVKSSFDLFPGNDAVQQFRTDNLIEEITGRSIRDLRKQEPTMVQATKRLVSLCKMTLTIPLPESLDELAVTFDVELNGSRPRVYDLVTQIMVRAQDVARDRCIDYDDMIWIPVIHNLPVFRYDLLLVDEAQDLNRCQQSLAKMAGRRLILCGDDRQAIYGFAGADSKSMDRMYKELSCQCNPPCSSRMDYDCGVICQQLPLTVTRRCGKAIVAEARKIVSDFEAFPTNPEGKVGQALYTMDNEGKPRPYEKTYQPLVRDGDMVLCRVNAPLVSQCFQFLKRGQKATIQGRDIGQGLIGTIKKVLNVKVSDKDRDDLLAALARFPVKDLIGKLTDWQHAETEKETAKRNPSESKLIAITDRVSCLICFCSDVANAADVVRRIESVFTDDKSGAGIRLSSGHKAKGLESKRVWILLPKGAECPHPMARTAAAKEQEWNLLYVMRTRAIEELYYVFS